MLLNLSPNSMDLRGLSLEERLVLARDGGFESCDLMREEVTDRDAAERLAEMPGAYGLQWGLCNPPVYICEDDTHFDAEVAAFERSAALLKRAGVEGFYNHIWSGHDSREWEENAEWHRVRVARVAAICRDHGLCYGLEFLGPATLQRGFRYPFIRRLDEMLDFIASVDGGAGLGLALDSYHLHCSGGTVADLAAIPDSLPIVTLHLNDAPADRSLDEQLDLERAMPLETGIIDATGIVRWLQARGRPVPTIAEPFEPWRSRLAAMPRPAAARLIAARLRTVRDHAMA